jgi:hypothetical protein
VKPAPPPAPPRRRYDGAEYTDEGLRRLAASEHQNRYVRDLAAEVLALRAKLERVSAVPARLRSEMGVWAAFGYRKDICDALQRVIEDALADSATSS